MLRNIESCHVIPCYVLSSNVISCLETLPRNIGVFGRNYSVPPYVFDQALSHVYVNREYVQKGKCNLHSV